jgi:hypothetical protein
MVLVGYWPLNESSGSTAYDHSGNENHGSINDGGDSTVPGATGVLDQNAYSFDGSNDYVDNGGSSFFDLGAPFTLAGWIWIDSSHPDLSEDEWNLLGKYDGSDGWIFRHWHGGLELWYSGNPYTSQNYTPQREKWINWAVIHNGSKIEYFIDGKKFDSVSVSTASASSSQTLKIGQRGDDIYYSNGKIAEARIYDHALTPREVQYLYRVGKRGRQVTSVKKS